ncbi:MAG: hypothetical protein LBI79_01785 [Nitrososphaerota archaeon]|nr:hypothetical protein [Nitrososphaerota archaeon]
MLEEKCLHQVLVIGAKRFIFLHAVGWELQADNLVRWDVAERLNRKQM